MPATSTFRHDDVFPIIAQLIAQRAKDSDGGYVRHDDVVAALLTDPGSASLVEAARRDAKWASHSQAASNMVAWFSQQITVGQSPWAQFFDRERIGRAWAYRPKTAAPTSLVEDLELSAIEGNPKLFFHFRRERSAALRRAKIAAIRSTGVEPSCEVCGFTTSRVFPSIDGDILEVHHRLPLSALPGPVSNSISDLALLCPNCHRAVHRSDPMPSVEQLRRQLCRSEPHAG